MNTIWNSLEFLQKLNSVSFWVLMSSLVLGLVSTYSMYAIGNRIGELRDQIDAQKEKVEAAERLRFENEIKIAKSEAFDAKAQAYEAQEKLKPRLLTEEQKKILHAEFLASSKFNTPIVISARMMDDESISYGTQIHNSIKETGWEIVFTSAAVHTFKGLAIFYHPKDKQSESCKTVQRIFTKADLKFDIKYFDITASSIQVTDAIYIFVGHK